MAGEHTEFDASAARTSLPFDAETERLFEINSPAWIDRARRATAVRSLGRLGPYELITEIGRGGQGEVYRAVQPGTGRLVALKRIAGLGLAPSDAIRARFAREVEALTRLSHPSVVTVHAAEQFDGHTVLVMELVEGEPIDRWADTRWEASPGALNDVLTAFASACDGVAHAHARGVVHRDIKPSNVLVDEAGGAKVLDFGIAKVLDDRTGAHTTSTSFMGTPTYAAPERLQTGTAETDTRSDVYSLGVLLFRVLAGNKAFEGFEARRSASLPPPTRFRALPRECDWIVGKAASAEPERRYQTVEALARDIRALLEGRAIEAAPPSTTYRLRKSVSRYRYAVAAAAVVTLSLLAATTVSIAAAERARAALARETSALAASKESERTAVLEVARQQQVSALMRQVLGASGAVAGGRPNITVREALDNAVKARFPTPAERSPHLDPSVEASLRWAIGDTYLGIGRFEEAIIHLHVADEILRSGDKAGNADHLNVLYLLGRALRSQGRMPEAEQVLRRVVAAYRAGGDGSALPLADALSSLGVCLRWMNRSEDAEGCYREAMALYEKFDGPDSFGVGSMSSNIAILLSRRGEHSAAVPLARRSVAIRERAYPKGHPELANAHAVLGNVLWAAGEVSDGEASLRRAIAMDREISSGPSAGLAQRLHELAGRLAADRPIEALELQIEALNMFVDVSGPRHSASLSARVRASTLLRRLNRAGDAETLCTGLTFDGLAPGAESAAIAAELAEVHLLRGRRVEAREALELAWNLSPPASAATRAARAALAARIAELSRDSGDAGAAAVWSERAKQ